MLNRGLLLFGLLLAGSPAVAEDPVVAVDTLQGEALRGVLTSLTDAQLVLQTEQGRREIPLSELLAVRPDAAAAARMPMAKSGCRMERDWPRQIIPPAPSRPGSNIRGTGS